MYIKYLKKDFKQLKFRLTLYDVYILLLEGSRTCRRYNSNIFSCFEIVWMVSIMNKNTECQ